MSTPAPDWPRRQWLGVGLTALGLILLDITLPQAPGSHSHFSLPAMIAFEAGMLAVGALRPRELDVEGRDLDGVVQAMDYLPEANRHVAG